MSNLYRGPSIDASYQVSVHLAEGFQRRRLKCEKLTDDGRQVMAKAHLAKDSDINSRPWQRLAISDNLNLLSTYVIWNILVLNIKGKVNKIAIIDIIACKYQKEKELSWLWSHIVCSWIYNYLLCNQCLSPRGVTIHFFHKRYVSRYLICITIRITIRFIGNCNYSLKSMLVDMGAAMFFFIWGRLRTSGNYKYLIFD